MSKTERAVEAIKKAIDDATLGLTDGELLTVYEDTGLIIHAQELVSRLCYENDAMRCGHCGELVTENPDQHQCAVGVV